MSNDTTKIETVNPYIPAEIQRRLYQELGIMSPSECAFISYKKPNDKPYDTPEDRWVWVTGYKGMDKNMKCRNDFQYEIGNLYNMPEDAEIKACSSGFHFCLELKDVFQYMDICNGHRFFEVRALVRESDKARYRSEVGGWYYTPNGPTNKLAAKSIEIVRELSADEILAHITEAAEWSDEVKSLAIEKGVEAAKTESKVYTLTYMGYSPELARYICKQIDDSGYELAVALDTQPDISMDTKILAIFSHI